MKKLLITMGIAGCLLIAADFGYQRLNASEPDAAQRFEYVTARWAGRENTHVIRPGAKVEMVGPLLAAFKKPDRVDERAFYMNIVINALAKEGYEIAAMAPDDIVMKRPVVRR